MTASPEAVPPRPSLPRWRTPAIIIGAGCLLALLSFGIRASFGLFLAPMSGDFGWGREVFAFAIAAVASISLLSLAGPARRAARPDGNRRLPRTAERRAAAEPGMGTDR